MRNAISHKLTFARQMSKIPIKGHMINIWKGIKSLKIKGEQKKLEAK